MELWTNHLIIFSLHYLGKDTPILCDAITSQSLLVFCQATSPIVDKLPTLLHVSIHAKCSDIFDTTFQSMTWIDISCEHGKNCLIVLDSCYSWGKESLVSIFCSEPVLGELYAIAKLLVAIFCALNSHWVLTEKLIFCNLTFFELC